jgi:dTDP-4-dehydrorhamnose reductase
MRTILITGSNGQLGYELIRTAGHMADGMVPLTRSDLDITNAAQVQQAFASFNPWLVINAAAYTKVDLAESEAGLAFRVNRDGPANLAAVCAETDAALIHISTDFVFDGGKGAPYTETDPIGPVSVYGRSKAAGEAEIRQLLSHHIIIRTSWLYGVHGHNFVKTMIRLARERDILRVVMDQQGSPTNAADLAAAIWDAARLLKERPESLWGTYHYSGAGPATWHGFASEIIRFAREYTPLQVRKIEGITTAEYPTPAVRPAYSMLDCGLIQRKMGIIPRPWVESLGGVIAEILGKPYDRFPVYPDSDPLFVNILQKHPK